MRAMGARSAAGAAGAPLRRAAQPLRRPAARRAAPPGARAAAGAVTILYRTQWESCTMHYSASGGARCAHDAAHPPRRACAFIRRRQQPAGADARRGRPRRAGAWAEVAMEAAASGPGWRTATVQARRSGAARRLRLIALACAPR
jgi:hypothetical protein